MKGCSCSLGWLALALALGYMMSGGSASGAEDDIYSKIAAFARSFENLGTSFAMPNVSQGCTQELAKLMMNNKELFQYLDALGKPGSGILLGNHLSLGSYEECKQIPSSHMCTTTYDIVLNNATMPISQIIAVCTPDKCSESDIFIAVEYLLRISNLTKYAHPNAAFALTYGSPVLCQSMDTKISSGAIVTIVLCSLFLLLTMIGTVTDMIMSTEVMKSKRNGQFQPIQSETQNVTHNGTANDESNLIDQEAQASPNNSERPSAPVSMLVGVAESTSSWLVDFALCFSMTKNASAILSTHAPRGAILSINGIRTLSMWWVILGHTYVFTLTAIDNNFKVISLIQRFSFLPIINGTFSVDSFFFLSGLLVSYLSLRRVSSKGGFPWLQYYLHRFLRLTPAYMFVILFIVYIYPMMGSGPTWYTQKAMSDTCAKYWWTNLLYINNFYPAQLVEECMVWSWYLANDMQFYIISPIIILAMARFKFIGALFTNGIFLSASFITTATILAHYGLPADTGGKMGLMNPKQANEFMNFIYVKPYCRISPYLVGLFLGYILFKQLQPARRYRTVFMAVGWCVAIVVGLSTIWGNWHDYEKNGRAMGSTEQVFYGTFTRFSWGCTLAWLVYACHSGYGGLLNRFLSWRAFIPTSRLTYSAYLLHPLVMYLYVGSLQVSIHYTDTDIVYLFASFLSLSYACAFVLALFVEYPLMNVEQLVFKRK